ncbi:MarR family winged helix-turn-helix transcriptional regulator [Actinoplanes sp. NBRC 101535]|uniref:MarR family winged helix-turn-helix transcriptional regulator n=1 Tax=Actinoplanes sp. NBRC 101535 TaxID=3032196 RepID=UPI0024A36AB2|nr:MarR family winged helix-turn-helix transcriptional regulator [Actinoplanes sp. NBRC 101535]GLY07141.1 MarR family transcriptional regulator [Actinoplanes sp. NBRC 101535]
MSPDDRGAVVSDILRNVRPLVLNSARVVEHMLRAAGITVGMRAVLEVLFDDGPAPVPALADRLDLARQGIQRHVNDLLALGCVESRENPAHRRSVLIALTPAGTATFERIRAAELRDLDRLAPDCTADELITARKVLNALNRDIRRKAQP